ncbi:hypothetical protein DB30_05590 [Enhygromyxa salina]|uniref:Uncharacterized protein n=1 Tax=Enhygromyxa salina TaxID=215803 RepID=A0A0C1ZWP2_9BACT|nr:hypothetical protein DB30_05590 [Enhygromyxa salina]
MRERLVSMLLRFMGIVDSPICVYQSESTQQFQAPQLSTVDEALQAGDRWQGDIVIVDSAILDSARLAAFAERDEFIRRTTDGKIILDYLEGRSR